MVEVIEAYRDYAPPFNARSSVEELVAWVPEVHLGGLRRVVLTNSAALTGKRKRRWSKSRGRKARHSHVTGLYHHAWRGEPAWIELFVDQMFRGAQRWRWLLRFRLARNPVVATTLFHELGHHIHTVQSPEHRDAEDVADEWAGRLLRQYARERHRVLWVVVRFAAPLVRFFLARRKAVK